jgi:hypothetical protein
MHFAARFLASAGLGFALAASAGPSVCAAADDQTPSAGAPAGAAGNAAPNASSFKRFADVVAGATKNAGLIDLYRLDQRVYAALRPSDLETDFLAPIAVARGVASAGASFNYDDQWILAFRRVGDRVQLVRRNHRYEAPPGSPLAKSIELNYADSILMSTPIVSVDGPDGALLIDLGDFFLTNFANLAATDFDRNRSSWRSVKAFPRNVELEVEATFGGNPLNGPSGINGDVGFIDRRGVTLVLHYSLVKMPDDDYRPRLADPRLGHFVCATKDFGSRNPDSNFVRRINRWRLEKADPNAAPSPPKRQITWWIEDTAPLPYRPYIERGLLKWNEAFERIGFQNAIAVRWQTEDDRFDPEDVNHCVFRWVTTPAGVAMSNIRANPKTGEIIDADILFDSSWIRYWQREKAYLVETSPAGGLDGTSVLAVGDVVSPAMGASYGFGMPLGLRRQVAQSNGASASGGPNVRDVVSGDRTLPWALAGQTPPSTGLGAQCQLAEMMQGEVCLARIAAAALPESGAAASPVADLPLEVVGQILEEVVMHEAGHALGLRHNFLASTEAPQPTPPGDEPILSSSVMDYLPLNLTGKGGVQGAYATPELGPYDYWAIEYAYKPIEGDEAPELARIAGRSTEPGLAFAGDEDCLAGFDPYVNQYDLGADPLKFASDRLQLVQQSLDDVDDRLVADGASWSKLKPAVLTLFQRAGDAVYIAARFIGGRRISHDFRGQAGARDPVAPVDASQQRAALAFLTGEVLVDSPLTVRPELLRRMGSDQWSHWGVDAGVYEGKVGASLDERILALQNIVLSETIGSGMRQRLIESNRAMTADGDDAFTLEELFSGVHDAVWAEVAAATADEPSGGRFSLSPRERNLQQRHLEYLLRVIGQGDQQADASMAFALFPDRGEGFPADSRALARRNLKTIRRMAERLLLRDDAALDRMTRIHCESIVDQIASALEPGARPAP